MEWEQLQSFRGEEAADGSGGHGELLARVQRRTGLETAVEAGGVVEAVLRALGGGLYDEDLRPLMDRLPEPISASLHAIEGRRLTTSEELFERAAEALGVEAPRARELVLTVCQALGRTLEPEALTLLRSRLPEPIAELIRRRAEPKTREGALHSHGEGAAEAPTGRTLASGRPGSERPLSEAAPGHRDSLSVNPEPRRERKLSSSDGAASTIATGRPGSDRPLSES